MTDNYTDPYLSELIKIRKTLEDIEFILEYTHVPQYKMSKIIRNPDGTAIRNREYLEAPLESLRKEWNRVRQPSSNHTSENEAH